jgi:hypothetical protein
MVRRAEPSGVPTVSKHSESGRPRGRTASWRANHVIQEQIKIKVPATNAARADRLCAGITTIVVLLGRRRSDPDPRSTRVSVPNPHGVCSPPPPSLGEHRQSTQVASPTDSSSPHRPKGGRRPRTRWTTSRTIPIRNKTHEICPAMAATPPKPRAPAINPTIKNISA